MKALIVSTDRFEDIELTYPKYRLEEEGIEVEVGTADGKNIEGKHETEIEADLKIKNAKIEEYDLLVIPGGRSPEHLRLEAPEVTKLVEKFDTDGKVISAICHGPQLLISAGILEDRKLTSYPSLKDDLKNAGAKFFDKSVVVDGNIITSRRPEDLPNFMKKTLEKL